MSGPRAVSRLRVRYAETDQMGIAHHAEYLAWFEVGRTDLLREHGLPYTEIEARGVRFPVIEAQVKYLRPARYDDRLEVRTTVSALGRARVAFAYEVVREGEEAPLATGTTHHAAVDVQGRPCRMPEDVRKSLAS